MWTKILIGTTLDVWENNVQSDGMNMDKRAGQAARQNSPFPGQVWCRHPV